MATIAKPQILVVGDSHARYFTHAAKLGLFYPLDAQVCAVEGATAVGMRNPENTTNSIARFRNFLKGRDRKSVIVIHLGENDCGFVIWYRAQKYQESIEQQTAQSVGAYFEFVDELIGDGFKNIVITGSTLPTIEATDTGIVVSLRASITATQTERTQLTLEYNRLLKAQAAARALVYVDITDEVTDPETNVVSAYFRNFNKGDHHMQFDRAARAWATVIFPVATDILSPHAQLRAWAPASFENYVKALWTDASKLEPHLRLKASWGSVLTGKYHGTLNDHGILTYARLNGTPLHPRLRLFSKAGWRPVPLLRAMHFYSKEHLDRASGPEPQDIFRTA